jgi:hypothetical protein
MRWRPWIVTAAMLASSILAITLIADEEIIEPKKEKALEVKMQDPLLSMGRNEASRVEVFKQFGFSTEMVVQLSDLVSRTKSERGASYRALLKEGMPRTAATFCGGSDIPPRYLALEFLVDAESGKRTPLDPGAMIEFQAYGWYAEGSAGVEQVFKNLELTDPPVPGATGMGIAAILLGKEADAAQKRGVWKPGGLGAWDLDKLFEQNAEAGLKKRMIDYFVLFQALYELANEEQGICKA